MSPIFYAHSVEGKSVDEWHILEEHLKGTAELAKSLQTHSVQVNGVIWLDFGMKWGGR